MDNIAKLKKRKDEMEEALLHCTVALNHDDYTKPFKFKRTDRMHAGLVNHSLLKAVVNKCIDRNIGFDPNLMLQHIEMEALDQFNEIAKSAIKGMNIPDLMEMRHDLELLMLKDRHEHYVRELGIAERALLEAINPVSLEDVTVAPVKKKKK